MRSRKFLPNQNDDNTSLYFLSEALSIHLWTWYHIKLVHFCSDVRSMDYDVCLLISLLQHCSLIHISLSYLFDLVHKSFISIGRCHFRCPCIFLRHEINCHLLKIQRWNLSAHLCTGSMCRPWQHFYTMFVPPTTQLNSLGALSCVPHFEWLNASFEVCHNTEESSINLPVWC